MIFTTENILLFGSIILFISILISKAGGRFGVPSLLLFLIVGMLFGADGIGFQFDSIEKVQFIGMVALSIILFYGGYDTVISEIKPVVKQGVALSTVGVILTTFITGTFIFFAAKLVNVTVSYPLSLLLAATMSSTDSASVFNILRGQRIGLRKHTRPMLELESGSNDPMAYMLTITLIDICLTKDVGFSWMILVSFILKFVIGILFGYLGGRAIVFIVNKIKLDNVSLYPIVLVCLAFFTFSFTELLYGNGYLAVYLAGLITGNSRIVKKRESAKFLDGITWFLQIIMFLALGLLVNPHSMIKVSLLATAIGVFLIFIGRPVSVLLTLLPFKKPDYFNARLLICWVGLRGATPIIFATYPVVRGVPGADIIFNIVFFITLLSLLIQGTTIPWVAKKLRMTRTLPKNGNDFGLELPEEIDSELFDLDLTKEMLAAGNRLMDAKLPKGILVIMVKRNEEYLIPNGQLELFEGDKLLVIAQADMTDSFDQKNLFNPNLKSDKAKS
ncbi:MAG: potassium/proton antiporter [Bacteroidales bacterium]|nr:potassium/proton antiporter [Bacteroidales bacterium]